MYSQRISMLSTPTPVVLHSAPPRTTSIRVSCTAKKSKAVVQASSRRAMLGLGFGIATQFISGHASANEDSDNPFIQDLLKKSAENKAKNDAERFNYDKQYESYIAIVKGSGYVPKTKKEAKQLGIERPKECEFPVFKESSLCKKFDELERSLE
mmetsp:Transcript_10272/g.19429  ORF Transcript_10272/g.19429 Transcript_10272/m.19429 type:complete len:154 (-) Transcript_10272:355-816(-)|eukprot:CAMPEP_0114259480 /NCGR_PEP_ID=MMETSP0058-20121206/19916_1 /TAXON_ID=36894 /ORGANISM="Pyramimonas parkeae, CCMP726" /LENGTH=153 /DNA_ID=CAMNT_0001374531 /DNA_START=71 /DNA_END=532 /DNA_ORIENTATION=-